MSERPGKTTAGRRLAVNFRTARTERSSTDPEDTATSIAAEQQQQHQQGQVPLRFLNYNHPSEANARHSRKAIRSHVTSLQHKRKRPAPLKVIKPGQQHRSKVTSNKNDPVRSYPTPDTTQDASYAEEVDEEITRDDVPFYQQMAMSRVNPFGTREAAADWSIEIPSLIDQWK